MFGNLACFFFFSLHFFHGVNSFFFLSSISSSSVVVVDDDDVFVVAPVSFSQFSADILTQNKMMLQRSQIVYTSFIYDSCFGNSGGARFKVNIPKGFCL